MADPFIGEIRTFTYTFPPYGWAYCNGQALPVNQFSALYALIGNLFGGNQTTFNVPNIFNQAVIGYGQGQGLSHRDFASKGGENTHSLLAGEVAQHNHNITAGTAFSTLNTPDSNYWGVTRYTPTGGAEKNANSYSTTPNSGDTLKATFVGPAGKSIAHENRQPFLTMNFCIALVGVFPVKP
jgi:microcystin-dependent protein